MEPLTEYEQKIIARLLARAIAFKPFFKSDLQRIARKLNIEKFLKHFMVGQDAIQFPHDSLGDLFEAKSSARKPRRNLL